MHTSGFIVLHGNRLEDLRDLTVAFVKERPLGPLVPELFLVQSNGMKHWLEQALADDAALGICAATRIELPASFLWQAYRAVLGQEAVPEQLPFDKTALTWRLLRLLPAVAAADASYAPLARYLEVDEDGRRAYQLAQQIADVFDGYQQYRADWLERWEAGDDRDVPAEQRWQPKLWRLLRQDVGEALAQSSRAAVHAAFLARMQSWPADAPRPAGLPPRIVVFGISALSMQTVRALAELGRLCQVLMVVQNPCRHYWGHVVEGRHQLASLARYRQKPTGARPMAALPTDAVALHLESHALLASWGKQGRDYLHLLDEFDQTESQAHLLSRAEYFTDPAEQGASPTRLARLQSGILNLEPAPALPQDVAEDPSIRFVTAHSAQREVEVLHDYLLGLLDEDASLTPRDIMVMVPEMSGFISHIQAVFGRFAPGHPRHLPYAVADASARQQPLVQALERLLHLPGSRVSHSDWLALFEVDAVRRRFKLTEGDIGQLREWLEQAGLRWGIDAAHRERWGLDARVDGIEQNTWLFALRRLLLGYAQGAEQLWQGVLGVPGISGLGAQRVGALCEWLDAVQSTLAELGSAHTPTQWVALLSTLLERFFSTEDDADERLIHRLRDQLLAWQQQCDAAALTQPLPLVVVREHWLGQMEAQSLTQRFFGGGVQFATLMPMRSIPFRVVCLLGMNDGDYPRRTEPRDFDLMVQSWRPGDRSRREDDRYLFLEALLCARERLYISWQGRRATDDAELPASVVVGQLLEELTQRFAPPPRVQQQPLQPFSRQYFEADSGFATYDADWQWQHLAPDAPVALPTGRALPLPAMLQAEQLERLLRQPVEIYWRSHLDVRLEAPDAAAAEEEAFELNKLESYQAIEALLGKLGEGTGEQALEALRLTGRLPVAAQGRRLGRELLGKAEATWHGAQRWLERYGQLLPLSLDLTVDGVQLTGVLQGLRGGEAGLLQLLLRPGAMLHQVEHVDTPRYHALLRAWVRHVLASAQGESLTTIVVGADDALEFKPLPAAVARRILGDWLTVYRAAWAEPLPIAAKSALAYLAARPESEAAARRVFDDNHGGPGEYSLSPYLRRSFEGFEDIAAGLGHWGALLYGDLIAHTRQVGPP